MIQSPLLPPPKFQSPLSQIRFSHLPIVPPSLPMTLPVVDCRSLVEFCKAYEQHRANNRHHLSNSNSNSQSRKHDANCHTSCPSSSLNALANSFCDQSPLTAVIDVVLLLLVVTALAVLSFPYLTLLFSGIVSLSLLLSDYIADAPFHYLISFVSGFFLVISVWLFVIFKPRKCGKPFCKGLRKAVGFDIQLETEQCVKCYPVIPKEVYGVQAIELGEDQKELEAELRKMAPINGRTVLIFREPCGCPAGRMEVWGPKKTRRIKK